MIKIMKIISILIPCYNEEHGIGKVIEELPMKRLKSLGYDARVFVIDNNSNDNTAEVAKSKGVRVINEEKKGKGNAIITGLSSVAHFSDYIVMLDGDNTYKPKEIPRLIEPLESEFCDAVAGSRIGGKTIHGSLKSNHRFANWFFAFIVRSFYTANITDALTGFMAFKAEVIRKLLPNLQSNDFTIEMEMITKMKRLGFDIYSVPITYDRRMGKSKLHSFRDGFKIFMMFIRNLFWHPYKKGFQVALSEFISTFLY